VTLLSRLVGGLDRLSGGRSTRLALNHALREWGRVEDLRVDRAAGRVELGLWLHGEPAPLRITVDRYRFDRERRTLTLEAVHAERAWMATAAERFLVGRPLPLPADLAALLDDLL
ncbi:MAG: hypothetical protein AAFZ65_20010, partial [Planctomycetota bacterium]